MGRLIYKTIAAIIAIAAALASNAQTARIIISVNDASVGSVAYQSLDEYSFVDSVAISHGKAEIEVPVKSRYQFFRLIVGNQKLPMILSEGDRAAVDICAADIWKSQISGSLESEYFLSLINLYRAKGAQGCTKMMRKNPDRIGNVFIADMLDPKENLSLIKSVALRFKDTGIPVATHLYNKITPIK